MLKLGLAQVCMVKAGNSGNSKMDLVLFSKNLSGLLLLTLWHMDFKMHILNHWDFKNSVKLNMFKFFAHSSSRG
jgi:hypothetical protein